MDDVQIVRDEQIGQPALGLEFLQQVEHLRLHRLVQRGDRLVQDQQARLERQRAGDVDALALAARQFVRIARAHRRGLQADARHQRTRPGQRVRFGGAVDLRSVRDRFEHRQPRIERCERILEHHLQVAPEVAQGHAAILAHAVAVEHHFAAVGFDQAGDEARGGGLAAARLTDDAQGLALVHREAHSVDGPHDPAAGAKPPAAERELFAQLPHQQQRLGGTAAVRGSGDLRRGGGHRRRSMAERTPSASRLKATDVTKIITPGSAAIQGLM